MKLYFQIFLFTQLISFFSEARTVCTMTLNSSNEINVMKRFSAREDQFVELTQFENQTDNSNSWLANACDRHIQCDTVVISGHFAGEFFGNKNKELSLSDLTSASCSRKCNQLFQNTTEVYLFGCNTLAKKGSELTNLDLYFNDLIVNGYSQATANRIKSNIDYNDGTYLNTMRAVFSNAKLILGFEGKAPLGAHMEKPLRTAFMTAQSTDVHYSQVLKKLIPNVFITEGLKSTMNPFCGSEIKNEEIQSQINWLSNAYDKNIENSLDLKIVFYELYKKIGLSGLQAQLSNLNEFYKQIEYSYHDATESMVAQKMNYLEILEKLNPQKYADLIQKAWLGFSISKTMNSFSYQNAEKICQSKLSYTISIDDKMIDSRMFSDKNFLIALGCLRPENREIQKQIVRILDSNDIILANTAYYAIKSYHLSDHIELKNDILKIKNDSYSPRARMYASRLLDEN